MRFFSKIKKKFYINVYKNRFKQAWISLLRYWQKQSIYHYKSSAVAWFAYLDIIMREKISLRLWNKRTFFYSMVRCVFIIPLVSWKFIKKYNEFEDNLSYPKIKSWVEIPRIVIYHIHENLTVERIEILDLYEYASFKGAILSKFHLSAHELYLDFLRESQDKYIRKVITCSATNLDEKIHCYVVNDLWTQGRGTLTFLNPVDFYRYSLSPIDHPSADLSNILVVVQPPQADTLEGLEYIQQLLEFLEDKTLSPGTNEVGNIILDMSLDYLQGFSY